MIINVEGGDETCPHMGLTTKGFLVGWLGTRLSILTMYFVALYNNKHTIPQFVGDITVSVLLVVVGFVMFIPGMNRPLFYKIAICVEFVLATPVLGSFFRPHLAKLFGVERKDGNYYIVPLNILVYQRRLCMFIMMVLGEGVIQVLEPAIDGNHVTRCYAYATCGLILLFSFSMLYCDAVMREHLDNHALRRSALSGGVWIYMHGPLSFFMYLVGISIKLAYHDVVDNHQIEQHQDVLLGVGCGAVVLCLAVMRSRHKGSTVFFMKTATPEEHKKRRNRIANYSFRVVVALLHWLAALKSFRVESDDVKARDRFLYFHCALAFFSIAIEVVFSSSKEKEVKGDHDSDHQLSSDGSINGPDDTNNPIANNDL
jgi:low temperature requirement protein LtrA